MSRPVNRKLLKCLTRWTLQIHRHYPRVSEEQIKQHIVRDALICLGWRIEGREESEVLFEHGRTDIVLGVNGKAKLSIETKAPRRLNSDDLKKEKNKALEHGCRYLLRTDGIKWELYELLRSTSGYPVDEVNLWDHPFCPELRPDRSDMTWLASQLADLLSRFCRSRFPRRKRSKWFPHGVLLQK